MRIMTGVSTIRKLPLFILTLVGFSLIILPAFAWGPMRDTYTYQDIDSMYHAGTWPKDKIVFNSVTNGIVGDERSFISTIEKTDTSPTQDTIWKASDINVEDGKEYYIRFYVHNNNPYGWDGVAKDVTAKFNIPIASGKQVQVNGFLTSTNSEPGEIWDYVNFSSDHTFHLEYIYGSATLINEGVGESGCILSDDLVTTKEGILIGYNALDGKIPGGSNYICYIIIRVRAIFDSDLTVEANIKNSDHFFSAWRNTTNASAGDKIDVQVQYKNTSDSTQNGVAARVILPDGLNFIEGSAQLINSSHPDGAPIEGTYLIEDGISIGNYEPNAVAKIKFTVEVTADDLPETDNTFTALTQIGIEGLKGCDDYPLVMQDSVEITVGADILPLYTLICTVIIACFFVIVLIHYRNLKKKSD